MLEAKNEESDCGPIRYQDQYSAISKCWVEAVQGEEVAMPCLVPSLPEEPWAIRLWVSGFLYRDLVLQPKPLFGQLEQQEATDFQDSIDALEMHSAYNAR